MVEQNRELEQAISALTAEILKLVPEESGVRETLSVTLENAFSRLAIAILAQANQPNGASVPMASSEAAVAGLN